MTTNRKFSSVYLLAILIVAALSYVFAGPVFDGKELGIHDWDYFFANHFASVKSIQDFGQLPLWNPYRCGGIPLIGNPQSRFFSPMFILHLIFDTHMAFKLEILFHYAVGLFGFFLLAKDIFKIQCIEFCFFPAIIFMLNGFYSSHVAAGHVVYLCMAYAPFVLYFYFKSIHTGNRLYTITMGGALALILFEGTYPFVHIVLALALLSIVNFLFKRSRIYLENLVLGGVFTFGFGAIKLLPNISYLTENSRGIDPLDHHSLSGIISALFRYNGWKELPGGMTGSENIAYVGIPVFVIVFALWGFYLSRDVSNQDKKINFYIILVCLLTTITLLLGDFGGFSPYAILKKFPIYSQTQIPARIFLVFMIFLALSTMAPLKRLEGWVKSQDLKKCLAFRAISVTLLIFMVWDLARFSRPLYATAFPYGMTKMDSVKAEFDSPSFKHHWRLGESYYEAPRCQFPGPLYNKGVLNCYEPTGFKGAYRDELENSSLIESSNPSATISNIEFTPNKVTFNYDSSKESEIVLNFNYQTGWKSNLDSGPYSKRRRVAQFIPAGVNKRVEIYFLPDSFRLGSIILLITILASICWIYCSSSLKRKVG